MRLWPWVAMFMVVATGAEAVTFTTSDSTDGATYNPAVTQTVDVKAYSTRILGTLNGGAIFDTTYAAAFGDPVVQAGVATARAAITSAGGPGVILSAPVLVSHSETFTTASTTIYSLNHADVTVTTFVFNGPGTFLWGAVAQCAPMIASLPSSVKPVCPEPVTPEPHLLFAGDTVTLNRTHTQYFIDTTTTVTQTDLVAETYQVSGVVQGIGTVYTAVDAGIFDLIRGFEGRVLSATSPATSAAPAVHRASLGTLGEGDLSLWLQGFGFWSSRDAQGSIPGDEANGGGVSGGATLRASPEVTVGIAVEQDWQTVELAAAGEHARTTATQVGLSAMLTHGPWAASLVGIYGTGGIKTFHGSAALGGVSAASPDASMTSVLGQVSYDFAYDAWQLAPEVRLVWDRVSSGAFVETGGIALTAPSHAIERSEIGVGLAVRRTWLSGSRDWRLSADARMNTLLSGRDDVIPVAFVVAPAIPLTIIAPTADTVSADIGLGLGTDLAPGIAVSVDYNARVSSHSYFHTIDAGLTVAL